MSMKINSLCSFQGNHRGRFDVLGANYDKNWPTRKVNKCQAEIKAKEKEHGTEVPCSLIVSVSDRRPNQPVSRQGLNRAIRRSSCGRRILRDNQGLVREEMTRASRTRLQRIVVNGIAVRSWCRIGQFVARFPRSAASSF